MRKLAVTVALATTVLATPALARDKAWYVGIDGGPMLVEDIRWDVGTTKNAMKVDSKTGYDFDGNIGYDFGAFRLEAEVAYKGARFQHLTTTVPIYERTAAGTAVNSSTGYFPGPGGRTTALSFMVNGLLDFGDDNGLQGFVGGGVGIARVKADQYRLTNNSTFLNDSDSVFAYQAIAGIRAPITRNIDASLKYRFFTADKVRLVDVGTVGGTPRGVKGRFRSHSLLGGFTFNFGEPVPPPPPVVVAPPPVVEAPPPVVAPPPAVVCTPGPYIVFFDWDKSDITPDAATTLDNAVSQYQNCGNAQVMIAGFTDRSGTPQYNIGLSQRRSDSVRAYLAGHGIADGAMSTQAFGEDPAHLRVQTPDGVRELQNRRVEITYGPGSGQ